MLAFAKVFEVTVMRCYGVLELAMGELPADPRGLRLHFPFLWILVCVVFQQKCPKAFSQFSKRELGSCGCS